MDDKGIVGAVIPEDRPDFDVLEKGAAFVLLEENKKLRAEVARLTEGAIEVWAQHNPVERHAEPLYYCYFTDTELRDGLEHIKNDPTFHPARLIIDTQGEDET